MLSKYRDNIYKMAEWGTPCRSCFALFLYETFTLCQCIWSL